MFTLYLIFISIIGVFLFYHIQARIAEEQKANRSQFVKNNSHLEIWLRKSITYKEYYPNVLLPLNNVNKNTGEMTEVQKKSS